MITPDPVAFAVVIDTTLGRTAAAMLASDERSMIGAVSGAPPAPTEAVVVVLLPSSSCIQAAPATPPPTASRTPSTPAATLRPVRPRRAPSGFCRFGSYGPAY